MSVDDEIMGSGVKSASFDEVEVGFSWEGTICGERTTRQQTDKDGELQFFSDGNPKMLYLVPIQTTVREDETDTGQRTLWANGNMKKAIADAVRRSGASKPETGGYLKVTLAELKPPARKGWSKQKVYHADYTPPGDNALMAEQVTPEPGQAVVDGQPTQAAPAPDNQAALQAALAQLSPERIAELTKQQAG